MPGRTYSREFKLTVVRQLASGEKRPAQICREHNLANSMVSRWRQEYKARGEEAFSAKQLSESEAVAAKVAELERFCGQLAWENSVLKKALGKLKSPSDML
jgi:transposase